MTFLGHVVSDQGVEVDPKKIEAVKNWLRPLTPTYIRSFSGLDNYYRRFVKGFSSIASPLTTLTKNKAKFECLKLVKRASMSSKTDSLHPLFSH